MNEWTPYDFSFLTACEPTRLAVMRANCEKEITAYEASLVKTEKLLQAIQAEQDLRSAYGVKPRVTASRSPEHRTLLSLGALTRLLRAAEGGNSRAQAYWNRCAVAYTSLTDDEQSHLFETAKSNPNWFFAYVAATLDFFCGLRACEIKALQWKHISLPSDDCRCADRRRLRVGATRR